MNQIDFLPYSYRREHTRRRRQAWQLVAIALVAGIIAVASLFQFQTAAKLQTQLNAVLPQYQEAQDRNKRFAELKIELKNAQDQAELFTYLRHPWPKTQLVAALLRPLPKEVALEKVVILRKLPNGARRQSIISQTQREEEEKRLASLSPAARDLEQIRSDVDRMQTELTITGITKQPAALHEYVGQLAHESFFAKTQLESIESVKQKGNEHLIFELQLLVKPGYGQPGGPGKSPLAREQNTDTQKDILSHETKS
ncbi:MAG: PilN domain-containing protein [Pirellulales bacterium]|nr:PilN domain-containing protein [Pirellulales bacterium]